MVVGVDSCRAGWFAVTLTENGSWRCDLYPTIGALWAAHKDAKIILIDIPIGLPEDGQRQCDTEARRVLGKRRSTVFPVAARAALYASAYSQAAEINRRLTGKKFSKQLWNIAPKIREVDALLRTDPAARAVFKESHPEVIFWALTGHPMQHAKKTSTGFTERMALLEQYRHDVYAIIEESIHSYTRRDLARDDMVDALALAIAARLDNLAAMPNDPEYDARGLPMQLVYATMPRLIRLHHAQITVPADQVNEARTFYVEVLGLRETPKPEALQGRGGFWLALGDIQVHVGVEDGVDRRATKAHLAYQVANVDHWLLLLKERGVEIADSVSIPGYKRFEFRDPFGNRVELIQVIR